jgi:hypothetical protein
MPTEAEYKRIVPMSQAELLALDNICPSADSRPFGKATPSSRSFWLDTTGGGEQAVELARSSLFEGAYELTTKAAVNFGLPLKGLLRGDTVPAVKNRPRVSRSADAFVPHHFPVAYHPKIASGVKREVGRLAGGGRMFLSEEPHATIINGESRHFIYPDAYPYSAICKLHIEAQDRPGGPWGDRSHATGFLVGRRTVMTSGHAHPNTSAHAWRIQVIPACWSGRSVFGMEYVTYVHSARWWHSDAGNDFLVGELYDPIGADLGYFGAITYDSDWEDESFWTMCGYTDDRSLWAPSRQTTIAVRDDDDGDDISLNGNDYDTTQVESDADEASGASGSPLFAWFEGQPQAVGVHSGVQRDNTIAGTEILSCASGGTGFVEVILWARGEWP